MKIALCSSVVPFGESGPPEVVEWLDARLQEAGHRTERVSLPHVDSPQLLPQQMAAYRWVDLTETADRIICLSPPAHAIPHPNKVLWFGEHLRTSRDAGNTPGRGLPEEARHRALREGLHAADGAALLEARAVFTQSARATQRLQEYGVRSEVLHVPVFRPEQFQARGYGDQIVCAAPLRRAMRQHLLIEAMASTRTPVRLVLCGAGAEPRYVDELRSTVTQRGLETKVAILAQRIGDEERSGLLADCLAAAYLPDDEDGCGTPGLEAGHSRKAVLTTTDAGGVLELVQDGRSGVVSEPSPEALAQAMDRLYTDRAATVRMGEEAHARIAELRIEWPHVIARLLA